MATHPPPITDEAAAATVVTLSYDDLVNFDAASPDSALMEKVGQAFGKSSGALGILAVANVPDFEVKRQALLPLAARLPQLADLETTLVDAESLYSVGWSHGKEQLASNNGKPDTSKGSFYANPLIEDISNKEEDTITHQQKQKDANGDDNEDRMERPNLWPTASLPELQPAFCDMGRLLHHVGCLVATVCDAYCQQQGVTMTLSLAETLQHSKNAKGRLLHYFAMDDDDSNKDSQQQPWCAWHNDHGSLTGLVPGMYLDSTTGQPVDTFSNTNNSNKGGLYIQSRSGAQVRVDIAPTCCAFQIGETSQIQSGGLLQATPHAVLAAASNQNNITRESFALFLQPELNAPLVIPAGKTVDDCVGQQEDSNKLGLPPLKARWKQGMTFGDFHLATLSAFATTD